jgi:hypothetical protein
MKTNKYDANSVVPRKEPKAKYTLKRLNDGLTKTDSKFNTLNG